jgi:hypothetical protein
VAAEAVLPQIAAVVDAIGDVVEAIDPDEEEVDIDRIIITFSECLPETIGTDAGRQGGAIFEMLFELLKFIDGLSEHSETLIAKTVAILAFLMDVAPDQIHKNFEDKPGFELMLKFAATADIEPELLEQVSAFAGIEPE